MTPENSQSMTEHAGPYLVSRRDDGYGDVISLQRGQRYSMGRSTANRIVLKDELCSREHAEVYYGEDGWYLRDHGSLNGSRVNELTMEKGKEWLLTSGDELQVGRSNFLFVENLEDLPDQPNDPKKPGGESVSIKKRLGQTRFLTPQPDDSSEESTSPGIPSGRSLSRDLALLYRLALDMGSSNSYEELARVVLDGLLEAVPAEVGAILTMKEGRQLEVTAHRHRDPSIHSYALVSEFVTNEVLASREAILAEDVSRDRYLRKRESLRSLGATSLICAPVIFNNKVLGLIHLYCTDPHKALASEDLEFTMAVAKQLGNVTHQIQRQATLQAENSALRSQLKVESELVGQSQTIRTIEEQVGRVAGTNATVLIRGESGSGKELVARAIHYSSPRKEGPFVCLNCAAITESLLESELFGHEKGSFTGATEKKIGKFEAAHHGTIFLDEIGEMSFPTQAKLLRVLEGHPFERVGGGTTVSVDVRVVAATNQPLEQALKEGKFRHDLFFRLQVVEIRVPPLRDRPEDIPQLAEHFLHRFVAETGRKIKGFTPGALQKMRQYHWPGNVRELRNAVERAVALGQSNMIDTQDVWLSSLELHGPAPQIVSDTYEPLPLDELEKRHILRTLEHATWNKSQAAGILQIERSTLDRKIKGYGLKKDE